MWFSSWTGFSGGNTSCLRYCFWLTGFPGWNFQSHLGNLHVHTCTMNLSRKCHLNPMSRCEIFWDVRVFLKSSLFTYSKFAVSFISLFASLFFLLIVSLSTKTPHISLPTDSYFSLFLLELLASSVVLTFLLSPDALPSSSLLCVISLPYLASCPIYKSWTISPVPNMTYKMEIHFSASSPAVRLYRSSKLHARTSTQLQKGPLKYSMVWWSREGERQGEEELTYVCFSWS